ncbi:DNA polymerase alpha/epsilon subunit B-domain-containing protein [Pavlovales sp. CCMP2436]|nr:DNA polymerase alpha/epsilon subunit B-domain-containing protein [Pavlovales sp. CCMP2436]
MIDGRQVATAINALRGHQPGRAIGPVLEVIDAFDVPRLSYESVLKSYRSESVPHRMHGNADDQREVYAGRYALIRQRLLRNNLFKRPALEHLSKTSNFVHLTDVEALSGCTGRQCILGLLCEPSEGVFHLEDLSGTVPVDLSDAKPSAGLFTLGCFVLTEGELLPTGVFKVEVLCFPPPEPREQSISLLENVRCFGPNDGTALEKTRADLLSRADEAMLIVVSDCWLDRTEVVSALEDLLDGYEAATQEQADAAAQFAFLLCGNFVAEPLACTDMYAMRAHFDKLAEVIRKRPTLAAHSHFVFAPGPKDLTLGASEALPRSRLPATFTAALRERVKHVHFASAPARLRFYGREIVVFREDLVVHTRRNAIVEPNEGESTEMSEHLVKTIVDQAHLRPSLLSNFPVFWNHDHALQLPFTPDVLVLADNYSHYEVNYEGCLAFNPGMLMAGLSWMVYRPASNTVEYSALA